MAPVDFFMRMLLSVGLIGFVARATARRITSG
jgi:hypothetical protein